MLLNCVKLCVALSNGGGGVWCWCKECRLRRLLSPLVQECWAAAGGEATRQEDRRWGEGGGGTPAAHWLEWRGRLSSSDLTPDPSPEQDPVSDAASDPAQAPNNDPLPKHTHA